MGDRADVVIVGAGLSGLCAARKLRANGASVVVIEARNRVGGRTRTERIGQGTFDLGAQWVGPEQKRVRALIDELGIETFPTYTDGSRILEVEGKLSAYRRSMRAMSLPNMIQMTGALSYLKRVRERISSTSPMSAEGAEALDGETFETWLSRFAKASKIDAVLDAAVRTIFGAEPRDLSALYALMHLNAGSGILHLTEARGGAHQDRFVTGAQSISQALAQGLGESVMLGTPVLRLIQSREGVDAVSDDRTVSGRYAIVAVPPPLAARIEYQPSVSVARDQLTQRFAMGAVVKVLITYEKAFWRDAGFSGEVGSTDGPLSIVYDNTSHDGRQPALVGVVVGSQARHWSTQPLADRRRRVIGKLEQYFGEQAKSLQEYRELDWGAEPWSRGGPVGVLPPGVLTDSSSNLRKPDGRVHWAGAEVATEWIGSMEGAVQSGERAADEVLRRL